MAGRMIMPVSSGSSAGVASPGTGGGATSRYNGSSGITVILDPRSIAQMDVEFKKLGAVIRNKLLKQTVLLGARVFRKAALREAPRRVVPRLWGSLVVKKMKHSEVSLYEEGARLIVARKKHNVFYAHLVEFGHMWVIKRNGKVIAQGYKAPDNFMERAWDSSKQDASRLMLRSLRSKIVRYTNARRGTGRRLPRDFASGAR
jgi:hypothetical protein